METEAERTAPTPRAVEPRHKRIAIAVARPRPAAVVAEREMERREP